MQCSALHKHRYISSSSALYAQGLQGRPLEGEGVMSAALGGCIMTMLYMGDAALVGRPKVGLQSRALTEKSMHFCRMFRMRLSHKKSMPKPCTIGECSRMVRMQGKRQHSATAGYPARIHELPESMGNRLRRR